MRSEVKTILLWPVLTATGHLDAPFFSKTNKTNCFQVTNGKLECYLFSFDDLMSRRLETGVEILEVNGFATVNGQFSSKRVHMITSKRLENHV